MTEPKYKTKNSTPHDRRNAQVTIEAMSAEMEANRLSIERDEFGWWTVRACLLRPSDDPPIVQHVAYSASLDDAFTKILRRIESNDD